MRVESTVACFTKIKSILVFLEGNVGVISRSGTLTYEIVYHLTANGMGQSTAIGIGGDPVVGLHFRQLLEMFQNDPETEAIVLIGEIGGNAEEQAAEYIRNNVTKPVVAFIAGQSAPPGKQMGHAGAIISGAYFGDKISPLSETTILASSIGHLNPNILLRQFVAIPLQP